MLLNKLKYYLKTSESQRALDAQDGADLAREYVAIKTKRDAAFQKISWVLSCDDMNVGLNCVKQGMFREYYCPEFSPDVPCNNPACRLRDANNQYVKCNQEFQIARAKLDEFWAEKYNKVK